MSLVKQKLGKHINLGSSSEGNAYYLELNLDNGKVFKLLIECGFEYSDLLTKMLENNIDLLEIDAVLVTHEHNDHSKSVKKLVERGLNVYAPQSVFDKYGITTSKKYITKEQTVKKIDEDGSVKIVGVPLEHYDDKDNRIETLGYIIKVDEYFKILFVIDTKYLEVDLSHYEFNVIYHEANYTETKIFHAEETAKQKQDIHMIKHYNRLRNSHCSLENATKIICGYRRKNGEMVRGLNLSKTELIILTHLTSDKTTKPIYYKEYLHTFVKRLNPKTLVLVARRTGGYV